MYIDQSCRGRPCARRQLLIRIDEVALVIRRHHRHRRRAMAAAVMSFAELPDHIATLSHQLILRRPRGRRLPLGQPKTTVLAGSTCRIV